MAEVAVFDQNGPDMKIKIYGLRQVHRGFFSTLIKNGCCQEEQNSG
jgi:hypothetical protein